MGEALVQALSLIIADHRKGIAAPWREIASELAAVGYDGAATQVQCVKPMVERRSRPARVGVILIGVVVWLVTSSLSRR